MADFEDDQLQEDFEDGAGADNDKAGRHTWQRLSSQAAAQETV